MENFNQASTVKPPMRGLFWRPDSGFVEELAEYLQGKRVLEVFAGNGYLARLLYDRGVMITATSVLSGMDAHEEGLYYPVTPCKASEAVGDLRHYYDVLLMCWPTVTMDALHSAHLWGSSKDIIFIGEVTDYAKNHLGGCATDDFFNNTKVTHSFDSYHGNALERAVVLRYIGEA